MRAPPENAATAAALSLLSAQAVRTRAHRMLAVGLDDALPHFRVELDRLEATVDLVLAVTRASYPTLDVPFHSRWRHFAAGGEDRWTSLAAATHWPDRAARARTAVDLAVVSVLLDAGAGPDWAYVDPRTGARIGRSEGLALASFDMFARGAFSERPDEPLRAGGAALARLPYETLRRGFQVTDDNPLVAVDSRTDLLRRLGAVVTNAPHVFGRADVPRPGGLFDHLAGQAGGGSIAAGAILSALLHDMGAIWPSRLTLGGVALGDCWRHPALTSADATSGLMPLHKLSQWLAYSLIEPLQAAGVAVVDVEGLTGLAEYRNGGLFIDTGVLALRHPQDAGPAHDVSSTLVVEWRALTVALLDRLAESLRQRLGMDANALPLAKILQGGTWAAGRKLAYERADGAPPLRVISDGTVF
ncbi:MAG TPA: URC4/urg3 family protein [Xanthobacteraceae bacterium]